LLSVLFQCFPLSTLNFGISLIHRGRQKSSVSNAVWIIRHQINNILRTGLLRWLVSREEHPARSHQDSWTSPPTATRSVLVLVANSDSRKDGRSREYNQKALDLIREYKVWNSVVHVGVVLNSPSFQKVLPDVSRSVERCIRLSRA
jgi:hypothetical protein